MKQLRLKNYEKTDKRGARKTVAGIKVVITPGESDGNSAIDARL
jgi:hypothetical protein